MGRDWCSKLYRKHNKRVQTAFRKKATDNTLIDKPHTLSSNTCNERRNNQNVEPKDIGTFHPSIRVLVKNVPQEKIKWKTETNFQPKRSKPIPISKEISSHQSSQGPRLPAKRGFYGKDRHSPSIFPYSRKSPTPKIPLYDFRKQILSDDMHAVRPVNGTHNIRQNNKLVSKQTTRYGYKDNSLPRRFSHSKPKLSDPHPTYSNSKSNAYQVRMGTKRRKIVDPSPNGNRIPRANMEHRPLQHIPSFGKEDIYKPGNLQDTKSSPLELGQRKEITRETQFRYHGNPYGKAPKQEPTTGEFTFTGVKTQKSFSNAGGRVKEMLLVDKSLKHDGSLVPQEPIEFYDDGCVRQRVGGTNRKRTPQRNLEMSSKTLAHQPKRIVRCLPNNSSTKEPVEGKSGAASVGQPNGNIIHSKPGGHEIPSSVKPNEPTANSCEPIGDIINCALHSEQLQHGGRQPVSPEKYPRLAFVQNGDEENFQSLGRSTNRPICFKAIEGGTNLCNQGQQRHSGVVHKCVQSKMVIPVGMDIPSSLPNSTSSKPPESSQRNIHSDCSEVGTGVLASRSKGASDGPSDSHPELASTSSGCDNLTSPTKGTHVKFGGLENTGWSRLVENCNCEDISLLQNSWRASTLKTYSAPWREWLSWTSQMNISPNNPSPEQIAQHLAFLYRKKHLAPSTIKLHKSVVITFSNPLESETTVKNPLIKHLIKAMEISKPQPKKKLIWDINTLINWMRNENINKDSIFQVSRRVALILLLASGRRIHDLTLLSIDIHSMERDNISITFWPEYGSKTDGKGHRQSGWKLLEASDTNLDPVFWVNRLILVSQGRRKTVTNLNNLFITSRGKIIPASRSIIAGWIKTAFKDAGISFSPGSIRSAVASARWNNNISLETILKNGNWQGSQNFFKYYYKEIDRTASPTTQSEIVNDIFVAIP